MRRRISKLEWAAALGLVNAFGTAWAAEPPATPSAIAAAKYAEATRQYTLGAWEKGIQLLEEAHGLYPNPALLFNIAYGYEQMGGRCVDALGAYGRYFTACNGQACPELPGARSKEAATRAACVGHVQVETDPAGAVLTVNGKGVGVSPVTLNLPPGHYTLGASKASRVDQQKTVDLEPGALQVARFVLPAVTPPTTGPAARPAPVATTTEPDESAPDHTAAWIAFGAGGVGLITGGIFAVLTSAAVDDRDQANADFTSGKSNERARVKDLDDEARRNQVIAFAGFGVGLVGAATGTILLLLQRSPGAEAAGPTPVAGPGFLGLHGSF